MRIIAEYRARLAALYASPLAPEDMRHRKAEVFAALVVELRALDARFNMKSKLAEELAGAPNNARLASLATYYECVPGFQRVLAEQQHDLPKFYAAVHELGRLPKDAAPRAALRERAARLITVDLCRVGGGLSQTAMACAVACWRACHDRAE